jgi:outer membrane protein assembly factor BamB
MPPSPGTWRALALAVCLGTATAASSATPGEVRPAPVSEEDLVAKVRQIGGVCVHLGCGDGTLSARLADGGRLLVDGLEKSEVKVAQARAALLSQGLYGQVAVEPWTARYLPYADNLVNVIVAEEAGPVSESELLRVLTPRGAAFIKAGSSWRTLTKPWPAAFDEWTHARHGADGNMVSRDAEVSAPAGLRWVAGPAQDAGGKKWYYDHLLVSANGRNFYMQEEAIMARDAFNGVLLWSRPLKPAIYREKGAQVPTFLQAKTKQGLRTSRVKPVARRDHLYVATDTNLMQWDARTGATTLEYGPVPGARILLVVNDSLVVASTNAVLAVDAASSSLLWRQAIAAEQIVASDRLVFAVARDSILALNLATGRPAWQAKRVAPDATPTCTYHEGVLVVEESSWRNDPAGCRLLAYASTDGRLLWQSEHKPDMTHYQETRAFFARNLILLQAEGGKVVGLDPQTGKLKRTWASRGQHCATPVATERFFIAPECDFTDLDTGFRTRARMFKNACRLPFVPANGLLYSFPVQCECYPMLRGYMGLTSTKAPTQAGQPRLERGPAFGSAASQGADSGRPDEWPTYRHDGFRSGAVPDASLSEAPLERVWATQATRPRQTLLAADWQENPFSPGVLSAPVAADGQVFVAVPDEHRLLALEAGNGRERWSYVAGGRIDTPPTIANGLCVFGAHDGWVYCLEAGTGRLVWRFRAASSEVRMMAYGQMESPWPVPGNVLVDRGAAFFAAGRHPCSEDGVHVFAVKLRTGERIWEKTLDDVGLREWYSPMLPSKNKVGLDFEPVDMLVKDGEAVSMSRWRFDAGSGKFKLRLDRVTYDAGVLPVPLGMWSYGIRQAKMVQPRTPMCFDPSRLYLGTTNDVALIQAAGVFLRATRDRFLQKGAQRLAIEAPAVHDGLIAAYGHIYASTRDGKVLCVK